MSGVPIRDWYARVNAEWPRPIPALTEDEAKKAVKRLWKWGMGEKLDLPIVITSGRRYTWTYGGTLRVNASRGWDNFIHDLSHLMWIRSNPDARPHEKGHAKFELKIRKEVLRRGWLDGKLRTETDEEPAPVASKDDERRAKLDRVMAGIDRWERKLSRAQKAIAKLRRKAAGLNRHLRCV